MDTVGSTDRTHNKRGNVDTIVTSTKRQRARPPQTNDNDLDLSRLTCEDYTVGWVCALPIEMAAAIAMLDCIHEALPRKPGDDNEYGFGNISSHNIVIACLPSGYYGTNNAAVVANNMRRSFPSLETRLMIGIGGGVPLNDDIRLGDVVVGHEVIQYDFGKTTQAGEFRCTSSPVKPPHGVLTAVARLRAQHAFSTKLPAILSDALDRNPSMEQYKYPSLSNDRLFESSYEHDELRDSCDYCDQSRIRDRPSRPDRQPRIHYGTVASGNQVMKHGATRDKLSRQDNILCFEMEAAGMMDHFPCLVVRGICDYCDSHKNKQWQPYAAATAAAYAKELLFLMQPKSSEVPPHISAEPALGSQAPQHLNQQNRKKIVDTLYFEQINARTLNIKKPHSETCKWLLSHPVFLTWKDPMKLRDHAGFVWLKGNPGTGKSTIMKYLLKETQTANLYDATLHFFFNARGHDLEKTTLGMYRALLIQIFQQLPALQSIFDSLENHTNNRQQWTVEELEELFEQTMEQATGYSIICFVDALDECHENDVRQMLKFFARMAQLSLSANGSFRVCFSSRHYPYVAFKDGLGLEIILEDQKDHSSDITEYVKSELKIGPSNLARDIETELHRKASGIFMWAVLVVEILNREREHGRLYNLQRKLQEIPSDLHQLFRLILTQQTETDSNCHLLCFQWVLFARYPLTPKELYFALIQDVEGVMLDPKDLPPRDISLFVLEHSKGLAEITKSEPPTVEFIHESVRDFLLRDGGLSSRWPSLSDNLIGKCHLRLRDSCLKYIGNDIAGPLGLAEKSQPLNYSAARELHGKATLWFPFLQYAVQNIFFHADLAESGDISQKEFVFDFPRTNWIALDNIFDLRWIRQYNHNTRLNYILAELDASHLLKHFPSPASFLTVGEERCGCPLLVAIANDNKAVIDHFWSLLLESLSPKSFFRTKLEELRQASRDLVKLPYDFVFSRSRSVISHLAEYGALDIVAFLVECNRPNLQNERNTEDNLHVDQTQMSCASELRDTKQIDPCSKDNTGRTLISWAAQWNNLGLMKLLVDSGISNLNSEDDMKRTPISWASHCGSSKVVEYILQLPQVEFDIRDKNGQTPLSLAAAEAARTFVAGNHLDVVQLLLGTGRVDPDSKDNHDQTPLMLAACTDREHALQIVRALVETGQVDLNSRDDDGSTLLTYASNNSNIKVVEYLLTLEQIDFGSRDNTGLDALSWATLARPNPAGIVGVLLQSGRFDPDSRDDNGRSPLSWAASCRAHETSAELLLQTDKVDPDSRDNNGRSPLSWAASYKSIFSTDFPWLLIQSDRVDPDSRDIQGRNYVGVATNSFQIHR
uniref:NACHT domain-containing protein n=1 Tax=Bionectria ochroleuca TaxID=29856 RepID=A0A8H7TT64_BIOOC